MSYCPHCGYEYTGTPKFCPECGANMEGLTGKLGPETILEDRYLIVKTIGKGGMGAVYLALDQRLNNKKVAIKEMSTNAIGSGNLQAAVGAFKKEASMLIELENPALPRITDFFAKGEDRWYLVMDYVEGENLKETAEKRGAIPEKEVLNWAIQLCEILEFLHNQKPPVIFRDLKPSNIMLTPEGEIKLVDFGIARHFRAGLSSDTMAYGSSGFAPIEQYGQNQTDERSDIFALGATLHYLLTGIDPKLNPFNFEPPGKYTSISSRFEKAIMKAVELKPEDRPQTIHDFRVMLPLTSPGRISSPRTVGSGAAKIKKEKQAGDSKEPPIPAADKRDEETELIIAGKNQKDTADAAPSAASPVIIREEEDTRLIASGDEESSPTARSAKGENGTETLLLGDIGVDKQETKKNDTVKTQENLQENKEQVASTLKPGSSKKKTGLIAAIAVLAACLVLAVVFSGQLTGSKRVADEPRSEPVHVFNSSDDNGSGDTADNQNGSIEPGAELDLDSNQHIDSNGSNELNPVAGSSASEIVTFADPNLEAAVREALGIPSGNITVADMKRITELVAQGKNILYLGGLEYAVNLKKLDLHYNYISYIGSLSELKNLQYIDLSTNQINDISALSGLSNLSELYLSENRISDLKALSRLTHLKTLWLCDIKISDISGLSKLTSLTNLNLKFNSISNINALSNLTNLTDLCLEGNSISNISALSNLNNLTTLGLGYNSIIDISALSNLANLEELYLYHNSIRDINALSNLKNLTLLKLWDNSISDIKALSNLTSLEVLLLGDNPITDYSPVSSYYQNLEYKDFEM